MITIWQDLVYGCRMLIKKPGFTLRHFAPLRASGRELGRPTYKNPMCRGFGCKQLNGTRARVRLVRVSIPLLHSCNSEEHL